MTKASTAARKQSRNISQPAPTIGLDLGDRHSWYCVLDEAGRIQLEHIIARRELIGSAVFILVGVALIALAPVKQPAERASAVVA